MKSGIAQYAEIESDIKRDARQTTAIEAIEGDLGQIQARVTTLIDRLATVLNRATHYGSRRPEEKNGATPLAALPPGVVGALRERVKAVDGSLDIIQEQLGVLEGII